MFKQQTYLYLRKRREEWAESIIKSTGVRNQPTWRQPETKEKSYCSTNTFYCSFKVYKTK